MARFPGLAVFVLAGGMVAGELWAQDPERGVVNWPAPLFWSPGEAARAPAESSDEGTIRAKALASAPSSPVPFIGITPCRIVDTRDANRPPGYGPPPLAPGVAAGRTFILAGQCGIADGAQAVSLNITVTNTLGTGYIVLYPQDGAFPPVSTLNYFAGQTVANAAIVPLGTGGAIRVVAGVSGTDLIIDTNGYYAAAGVGTYNTFLGVNAGNFTMTGDYNTASGYQALFSNTTGFRNTAIGSFALISNTAGSDNTATGVYALSSTTTGGFNTAIGDGALGFNTTGSYNTASGFDTLLGNTTGSLNTAIGEAALYNNTAGLGNIAMGNGAGYYLAAGDNNMYLGNEGVASESATVRIGSGLTHTRAFIAAVRGVTTDSADAIPVLIDSSGQLGTASSSARFKEEVQDMAEASSGLLKLRPVTFRYKGRSAERTQFGLIAEEVQEILPELVVCDRAGEVETVLYHEMPAMLVNELQKQQRRIERQDEELAALLARLAVLETAARSPAQAR